MDKRPIQTGDLVITEDGYYALVREYLDYGVTVLRSNGLETNEWESKLRQLPLKVNEDTASLASFAEALKPRPRYEQDHIRRSSPYEYSL
jgi:hypothetical protein